MYGASLGFIIMIAVVYRVQISSIGLQILTFHGAKLFVRFDHLHTNRYSEMEDKFNSSIEAMTLTYKKTHHLVGSVGLRIWDFSKIHDLKKDLIIQPIAPDYMDVTVLDLFILASSNLYRIDEYSYTAAGSQSTYYY